jgi:hypothetical protein
MNEVLLLQLVLSRDHMRLQAALLTQPPTNQPLIPPAPPRTEPEAMAASKGRDLRFLANVDPIDVAKALQVGGGEGAWRGDRWR